MGFFSFLGETFGLKDFRTGGWDGEHPKLWESAHPLSHMLGTSMSDRETIENHFEAYVEHAYKQNGPIFACIAARQFVFSEASFAFRERSKETGRFSDLMDGPNLSLLERPWPGGTTGELLAQMEQDVSLAGNSWWTITDREGRYGKEAIQGTEPRFVRLRPDWVELIIGSRSGDPYALDNRVVNILYKPRVNGIFGSANPGNPTSELLLLPEQVMHYSVQPDPVARFRGMSWITPILRELEADNAATKHKKHFFENAAVPNMMVRFDPSTAEDDFDEFVSNFREQHQGHWNAYKTLFLMGGADVFPLTHNFQQMEFSQTQGKGESRIAAAAGVPASWVGFSEGLQGSSLNAGNFSAARRRFADGTIRPLWRMAAASLEQLIAPPKKRQHLWYDDRDVAFLREDAKDQAETIRIELNAIDSAIKAGYEPDAAAEAVRDKDVGKLLSKHTGLVSVQMQAPTDKETREVRLDATTVHTLVAAGYTEDSVVDAVIDSDLNKLENKPDAGPYEVPEGQEGEEGGQGASEQGEQFTQGPVKPPKPGAPANAPDLGPDNDEAIENETIVQEGM